ncbi:rhodanese-like domain-containing protein [Sungkyunkwania multivorans]|uniref:Rhodanese-like domain-containing protein n=1 Tax=Sungkyunkwania multivorans TaxID=1173618 RepID=A0ABW3CZR9_9FLAO
MKRSLLILGLLLLSCKAQYPVGITMLDVENFANNTTKNVTLVDVRTPEEYADGHIAGAANIDYFNDDFAKDISTYDKQTPIYIYCRSGKRSAKAATQMDSLGFRYIINLKGGLMAWEEANRPIVKDQ